MNGRNSIFSNIPVVTKNLIIINFIIWLAMMVSPRISSWAMQYCSLHFYQASDFNFAQLLTYMFMHSTRDFAHILFNMFTLFMFGITLERVLGSGRFLFYYVSCGIGAAVIQELVWGMTWEGIFAPMYGLTTDSFKAALAAGRVADLDMALNFLQTVGASGAIYGVLLAFGMLFPNMPLFIMFIPVPIKAKWMVIGYGAIELLIGLSQAHDGVAHFAHLGGMIFGFIMIWIWKKNGTLNVHPY